MRKILKVLLVLLVIGTSAAIYFGRGQVEAMQIGTGYAAHFMCSCVFVTERDQEACLKDEIGGASQIPQTVDRKSQSVEAAIFVLKSKAVFEEGKGCVLQ